MGNKPYKAKAAFDPKLNLKPRSEHDPDSSDAHESPVWRFVFLDLDGPFGWRKLPLEHMAEVLQKLKEFERLTWSELRQQVYSAGRDIRKTKNHAIKLERICEDARECLKQIKQNDIDEVFSLRLNGERRVFGIKDRATFKILWYDPDHKICPTRKG